MSQLKLSDLNACSKADFVAQLGNIFEYSPWIAEAAADARPFAGIKALYAAMKAVVERALQATAPAPWQAARASLQRQRTPS